MNIDQLEYQERLAALEAKKLENEIKKIDLKHRLAEKIFLSECGKKHGSAHNLFYIFCLAEEMGLSPMECVKEMTCIGGNVEMRAAMMSSLVMKAGHVIEVLEFTYERCTLRGSRKDSGVSHTVTYTIQEAQAAGLTGSLPWKKYANQMLYARSLSMLCRHIAPDAIKNSYVEGEVSMAVDVTQFESSNDSAPQTQIQQQAPAQKQIDCDVKKYTLEEIEQFVDEKYSEFQHRDGFVKYLLECQQRIKQDLFTWIDAKMDTQQDAIMDSFSRWESKNAN